MSERKPKGCLGRLWGFTWKATAAIIGLLILIGLIAGPPKRTEAPITEATGAVAVVMPTNAPTATLAPTEAPTATPQPWYAGGTLHSATLTEWRNADHRNKLATAADWAVQGFDTVSGLEQKATELLACVEEAFDAYASTYKETDTVTDIAVGCVILMKAQ